MSDSTIANLPIGSPAQATDQIPIQRGLSTLKLAVSDLTGSSSPVLTATVTLTLAQLIAASSTFPTLIPAPGVGKLLNPINIFIEWKATSTVVNTGGTFEISLKNASSLLLWMTTNSANFFNQSNIVIMSSAATVGDQGDGGTTPLSTFANTPLVLAVEDTLSGGNAGDTMVITILYNIITL